LSASAEIRPVDFGVGDELLRGTFERHAARLEHVRAIGEAQRKRGVLLDEQHRGPAVADAGDHRADRLDHDRREPERRLVEQNQRRPRHQRAADGEHLLLATGQRSGELLTPLLQHRERVEDARHVLCDLPAIGADEGAELQMLLHRHLWPDLALLRTVRDAEADDDVGIGALDRLAAERDRARTRREDAGDRAQHRRLAGAVRADQRHELAFVHGERHAVQHARRPAMQRDVIEREHRHADRRRGRPR